MRPPLPPEKRKTASINVKMTPAHLEAIKMAADHTGQPAATWLLALGLREAARVAPKPPPRPVGRPPKEIKASYPNVACIADARREYARLKEADDLGGANERLLLEVWPDLLKSQKELDREFREAQKARGL